MKWKKGDRVVLNEYCDGLEKGETGVIISVDRCVEFDEDTACIKKCGCCKIDVEWDNGFDTDSSCFGYDDGFKLTKLTPATLKELIEK